MAESKKTIYDKIDAISGLNIIKDAKNPHFKSSYATYDTIMESLRPLLKKQKLQIFHKTEQKQVCTIIRDSESGESIDSCMPIIETDNPQKVAGCVTYYRRYNVVQLFDIMLDDDTDGSSFVSQGQNIDMQDVVSAFPGSKVEDTPSSAPKVYTYDVDESVCEHKMEYKEGVSKNGKPYKMNKCPDCGKVEWL